MRSTGRTTHESGISRRSTLPRRSLDSTRSRTLGGCRNQRRNALMPPPAIAGELSCACRLESISRPLNSQRGMAGYLGFSERVNELDDAQLADLAGRALPITPTDTDRNRQALSIRNRPAPSLDRCSRPFRQNPDAGGWRREDLGRHRHRQADEQGRARIDRVQSRVPIR